MYCNHPRAISISTVHCCAMMHQDDWTMLTVKKRDVKTIIWNVKGIAFSWAVIYIEHMRICRWLWHKILVARLSTAACLIFPVPNRALVPSWCLLSMAQILVSICATFLSWESDQFCITLWLPKFQPYTLDVVKCVWLTYLTQEFELELIYLSICNIIFNGWGL